MFVDQQRRPGRRLRAFAILGESESESCRRFLVKLSLAEPDESILAAYYVFGQDPIWVYRSEDFDMIMHWEHPMKQRFSLKARKSYRLTLPFLPGRIVGDGRIVTPAVPLITRTWISGAV